MTTSTRAPEVRASDLVRTADLTLRDPARVRRLFSRRLDRPTRDALERVGRAAEGAGIPVYLVGGIVRDLLLRRPVRDLDLAVEGDAARLARKLGGAVRRHEAFGTATIELDSGIRLDLAATRIETYLRPAALPRVSRADLAADLARRDFSINAMAVPLTSAGPLGLIDPFRGREDLAKRKIRALHVESFADDPTRAFRAVRLAAKLGFEIEVRTARRMRAATRFIDHLSAARLRREIRYLLEIDRAARGVELAARFGLLAGVAAGWRVPPGTRRGAARIPRVLGWYRATCPDDDVAVWPLTLGLLLHASHYGVADEVLERLQPDRGATRVARDTLLALERVPRGLGRRERAKPSRIHALCRDHTTEGLLAVLAACTSEKTRRGVRRFLGSLRSVRISITGRELLEAGVPAGPAVARGLDRALEARLDGRARDRRTQLRIALAEARRS